MAHYCLHKLHKLPHEIFDLPKSELAVVLASIDIKIKKDIAERKEIERKSKSRASRRR